MTSEPDSLEPLKPLDVAGLPTATYRAYPIVDHIADKNASIVSGIGKNFTRYKDFADLVILADTTTPESESLRHAVVTELAHRELARPTAFELPDVDDWPAKYDKATSTIPNGAIPFDVGLAKVTAFLNPIFNQTAQGSWNPVKAEWTL